MTTNETVAICILIFLLIIVSTMFVSKINNHTILYIIISLLTFIIILYSTINQSPKLMNADDNFDYPVYVINLERKIERYNYVISQLEKLGITNYNRWLATDGFVETPEQMEQNGMTPEFSKRQGLPGCASSHVRLWKHIAKNKMGWTLILEDDAHFHPQFNELFPAYWRNVPVDALIVFPGHCCGKSINNELIVSQSVMCNHGYMISSVGAQYLLDNILPMNDPVDIAIVEHFRNRRGSYIFNGQASINGIVPDDYKNSQNGKCTFDGIIYQNQEEYGSTIHNFNTVFGV